MNAALGWALAGTAFVAGYMLYGWHGLLLAFTIVVFWLLLQFSRSLRALRDAAQRPVASVPSAVMLHARLAKGMRLVQILKLTRSLGAKLSDEPEVYVWRDDGGDEVRVELRGGKLAGWTLHRAGEGSP